LQLQGSRNFPLLKTIYQESYLNGNARLNQKKSSQPGQKGGPRFTINFIVPTGNQPGQYKVG